MNTEMSKAPHQIPSGVEDPNSRAHEGTHESREGVSGMYRRGLRHLRKYPKLRMFLSECRSFLWRTYIVLTSSDTYRVPIGSVRLEAPSERPWPNTRSHACIRDIERISSSRPWATPMDWAAYRDSWEAGVQWASSTFDSSSRSEHRALLIPVRSSDCETV
jgi:hypothetical protein